MARMTTSFQAVPSEKDKRTMFRKTRSDSTVGAFEKKHGLPSGTIRNPDGRKTRKDKTIGAIRREAGKKK